MTEFPGNDDPLFDPWRRSKQHANSAKRIADAVIAESLAGSVGGKRIKDIREAYKVYANQLNTFSGVTGINAFARMVENKPTLDVNAKYTALIAAINAVRRWIHEELAGQQLEDNQASDGTVTPPTFDTATLAPLRTKLQAVSDAVTV